MEKQIDYEERAALLKALSNPVRLQIVHGLLMSGCRNVGCMEASTGMSQSCISQHLQLLQMLGDACLSPASPSICRSCGRPMW